MLYALGVVVFAIGLLLSIALHEVGHMVPAKKFGVKVTQYMVGFGPTLWSRRRGDTEYGLKAIPLGGYIRMIGMVPPRPDGSRSRWPQRLASAVEDFRQVSRAEVRPGDEKREFYQVTPGKKMIIMLGGPCMNLLIYLVLTVILLSTIGLYHSDTTTAIGTVTNCVAPANATAAQLNNCKTTNSPAALAGLRAGDTVTEVGTTKITNWNQLQTIIEDSPGTTLQMVVQRAGKQVTLSITPVRNLKYVSATSSQTKVEGYIGVIPVSHDYFTTLDITQIPGQIGTQLRQGLDALGSYPQRIGSVWQTVFDNKPRSINSAIGVVGIGRLGGDIAQSSSLNVESKVQVLIGLLAIVNLFLFFVNLLPLLPLDGGHVAGAIVEAAKRGRARLRARRGPAGGAVATPARPAIFVDTAQMLPVMYVVGSVLIVISLITLYADIVKPVNLG